MAHLTPASTPGPEPCATTDVTHYARIDTTADDTLVAEVIRAAREQLETITHRSLVNRTWTYSLDAWPPGREVYFPKPALLSVDLVEYVASSNTTDDSTSLTPFSSTNYTADPLTTPGRLWLKANSNWPSLADVPSPVQITFTAGPSDADTKRISLVTRLLATHWLERRDPASDRGEEIPYGITALALGMRYGNIH